MEQKQDKKHENGPIETTKSYVSCSFRMELFMINTSAVRNAAFISKEIETSLIYFNKV